MRLASGPVLESMECENDDGEACQPGMRGATNARRRKTPGIDDGRYRQPAGIVRRCR